MTTVHAQTRTCAKEDWDSTCDSLCEDIWQQGKGLHA
jgi:hypothetical protein